MSVEEFEQGHPRPLAALKGFLDCCRIEIGLSFHKGVECGVYSQQQLVDFALTSTASLLFPFRRLSRGFHSSGVMEILQLNCAIVRLTVMRPIIGALPDLSSPLF